MKRLNFIWFIAFFLGLSISPVFAQHSMWVTSTSARLKADRTASSMTIATLPIGAEVTVLFSERRWYKVRVPSGQKGWIYSGRLSESPPEQKSQDETESLFSSLPGSGIHADEADTSRSIRGLSRETEQYAKNRRTPVAYQNALDWVLSMEISERRLEAFLRKGKIGEYAP